MSTSEESIKDDIVKTRRFGRVLVLLSVVNILAIAINIVALLSLYFSTPSPDHQISTLITTFSPYFYGPLMVILPTGARLCFKAVKFYEQQLVNHERTAYAEEEEDF